MESRNDKLLESFMSQLCCFFFCLLLLDHVQQAQGRKRERLWTLAAAFLLSKPHPDFSQNVSFYFSAVAIVTFHDQDLRPFMKERQLILMASFSRRSQGNLENRYFVHKILAR